MKRVLFVAAENGALPGGKVGGVGDVVRDLPVALAQCGWSASVVTPGYGAAQSQPGAVVSGYIDVPFGGRRERATVYRVNVDGAAVAHWIIDHPLLDPLGRHDVYCDDKPGQPFATDASKFAFFCAAVATWVESLSELPDVLHLHDWHTALILMLREFDPALVRLKSVRTVFSLHNLAMQGVRPLDGDESSLISWFPSLRYVYAAVADPRYSDCVNPLAIAVRLADKLNTVSPTYAKEIQADAGSNNIDSPGEGLEVELRDAAAQGRLCGILNGCVYADRKPNRPSWKRLEATLSELPQNLAVTPDAKQTLQRYARRRPRMIVTGVSRLTAQKVSLLLEKLDDGATALEHVLRRLGTRSLFVLLGSGDAQIEAHLAAIASRQSNFLFVRGYDEDLADVLYECGDLFLMPSSFEPCGISQMLALRAGQPCLVHGVGGLLDTIDDGRNGFVFSGQSPAAQAKALVATFERALAVFADAGAWRKLRRAAAAARFGWRDAAEAYIKKTYESKLSAREVISTRPAATDGDWLGAIVRGDHGDPFAVLGPQRVDGGVVARVYAPRAKSVTLIDAAGKPMVVARRVHRGGVFEAELTDLTQHYRLRVKSDNGSVYEIDDAYRFGSSFGDLDLHLLGEGRHERIYDTLGAHTVTMDGVAGTRFAVWAPNAKRVSVVGSFNDWDGTRHVMRLHPANGIWEMFVPAVGPADMYKFELLDANGKQLPLKSDPLAHYYEPPPGNASIVYHSDYRWGDDVWQSAHKGAPVLDQPLAIYEVHAGSWRRRLDQNNRCLSYRELADELVEYVTEQGFTHIELMPISEHPFDGSWGYQPIGLYAPTQRFGEPDDCRYFIDRCHQAGLGVIVDWVPAHFPRDEHGLVRFDGTALYEHEDPRRGAHMDWGTLIFNYGRAEIVNYLIGSALYWINEFHIDGLRVDAVASMLYLDYSRDAGEWLPNEFGGNENLEAVEFMKQLNEVVHRHGAMTLAEESTSWPGVSRPVYNGGLGFTYKWNMGWMNDTLAYMQEQTLFRKHHHDKMTFGMVYAFDENFVLPLSHDEVVHGKHSLLGRMPGDDWQRFANLRAYLATMYCHPGKKLLFMGSEIAQEAEWNHERQLDWHLLERPQNAGMQRLVRDLNRLYRETPALYQLDFDHRGFEWLQWQDNDSSVLVWLRRDVDGGEILFAVNFTPIVRDSYELGVPDASRYKLLFNSDAEIYAGSGYQVPSEVNSHPQPRHGRDHSLSLTLPPLAAIVYTKF